jgi:hypothetical protein
VRTFPAIIALSEAVGRAAEMKKPIYYTTGELELTDPNAAQALAGISVLGYVAQLCAEVGVKIDARARMLPVVDRSPSFQERNGH